ncbi:hypothetical protein ACIBL3_01625 [Kribbella sp. NPDC050124]|uniref:PIN-like domain-containing protein n=1 Tax=Kribbella sp. NPDC050124 TaxID=3364114 RepID=UPI0037A39E51
MDVGLGGIAIPELVRRLGSKALTKHEVFGRRTVEDTEWIAWADAEDLVVLTKDDAIRRRPLERAALARSGLRVFCLTNAEPDEGGTGPTLRALVAVHPQTVRAAGSVRVWRVRRPVAGSPLLAVAAETIAASGERQTSPRTWGLNRNWWASTSYFVFNPTRGCVRSRVSATVRPTIASADHADVVVAPATAGNRVALQAAVVFDSFGFA